MSYSGTVHCSWCGLRGHNKLSCPSRKRQAESNAWIKSQLEAESKRRQRAVSNRTCSYCKKPGHNRRKCDSMNSDKRTILEDTRKARTKFMRAIEENGFGRGSLIKTFWKNKIEYPILHLVESIDWDKVDDGLLYTRQNDRRMYSKRVVKTRIASVASLNNYDRKNSWYNRPPRVGDEDSLCLENLSCILVGGVQPLDGYNSRDVNGNFRKDTPIEETGYYATNECWAQATFQPPEGWLNPLTLTQRQSDYWHFSFKKNADDWDKRRYLEQWQRREELLGEANEG